MVLIRKTFMLVFILTFCFSPLYAEEDNASSEEPPHIAEEIQSENGSDPAFESGISGESSLVTEEPASGDESAKEEGLPQLTQEEIDALFSFEAPEIIYEVDPVIVEIRSYTDIFPGLTRNQMRIATGSNGLRNSFLSGASALYKPASGSGIESISSFVMQKSPSHIVEALIVVPYRKKELEMLDIYNALGLIRRIQEQELPNTNGYRIFKDTTRVESDRNRRPVPDPAPVDTLPYTETMYLRFTDRTIGEIFIRGEITMSLYGITYSMTNFRDINFSIFTVMGKERFSTIIYLEPVKEGVLIYSMAGIFLPDFIASRLNLPLNINNRITVFTNWIIEGLRRQETKEERTVVPYAAN